jgi:hypothetical protein
MAPSILGCMIRMELLPSMLSRLESASVVPNLPGGAPNITIHRHVGLPDDLPPGAYKLVTLVSYNQSGWKKIATFHEGPVIMVAEM